MLAKDLFDFLNTATGITWQRVRVEPMNPPASSSRQVRVGLFEIDLASGQLHKNGRKLPLQEQPFRVLAMLLEHPGEVVTRQELQARLWPADTYVGFDEGLNTAIRKLRMAFGDSAGNPRFIETLPRRGYRFIAPVTETAPANGLPASIDAQGDVTSIRGDDAVAESEQSVSALDYPALAPAGRKWRTAVPVATFLILALTVVAYIMRTRFFPGSAPAKRAMLAILPFQNLSNDPAQEYFSDGLTEETITDLGQLSPENLGVIARTSAMAYKHTDKTVSQIGRELGVDYILEGSVRREGGKARVSAQLIRVSDQTHLWAQNYDRDLQDLLDVQNDVGRAIAEQVRANLTPQQQIELAKKHMVNPESYDLYLKGRFYWNQRTPDAIKESIGYFKEATAKDGNFALAYAGLADAYNISNIVGLYSPGESFPQAKAAAMRAIQLDPLLAEAHAALGMEKSHYDFDFPGAEREFLKAIEVNPNSTYAHLFYSNCFLMPMGRKAQAIAENKRALELDPLSLPINNFMGMTYMFAGDYGSAYRQFQHTIAMNPNFPLAHDYLSSLLTAMGRYEEAIKEQEKAELLGGSSPVEAATRANVMERAFRSGGEKKFWQKHLELELEAGKQPAAYASPSELARDYALAGQTDKAFAWLDKAYEEREGQELTLLKFDPGYKNLRSDPRFSALLQKIGLPQ
jgi:TolB-like protein/DNA-binding winged helix-turn-helix (wHTH) protein/Flp pilus assembly protein TadD